MHLKAHHFGRAFLIVLWWDASGGLEAQLLKIQLIVHLVGPIFLHRLFETACTNVQE
jgi:hypothetical protein